MCVGELNALVMSVMRGRLVRMFIAACLGMCVRLGVCCDDQEKRRDRSERVQYQSIF